MAVPVPHLDHSQLIPGVVSDDSDQLAVLLETAQVLVQNGDPQEALRWLRRAATLAAQEGRDERALTLARAAADFASELELIGTSIPSSAAAGPSVDSRVQELSSLMDPKPEERREHESMLISAPSSRVRELPRTTPVPLTILPPKTSEDVAREPAPLSEAELIEQLIAQGRAVRVFVKRSAREDGLYVVRKESSGKPPFGARKAVILLDDVDPEFFASDPNAKTP